MKKILKIFIILTFLFSNSLLFASFNSSSAAVNPCTQMTVDTLDNGDYRIVATGCRSDVNDVTVTVVDFLGVEWISPQLAEDPEGTFSITIADNFNSAVPIFRVNSPGFTPLISVINNGSGFTTEEVGHGEACGSSNSGARCTSGTCRESLNNPGTFQCLSNGETSRTGDCIGGENECHLRWGQNNLECNASTDGATGECVIRDPDLDQCTEIGDCPDRDGYTVTSCGGGYCNYIYTTSVGSGDANDPTRTAQFGERQCDTDDPDCIPCIAQGGIWTAIGCIDPTPLGIMTGLIRIALGVMGGVALVQLIIAGLMYQSGDQAKIEEAKSKVKSTLFGIAVLVFSVLILRVIGVNVLDVVPEGFF